MHQDDPFLRHVRSLADDAPAVRGVPATVLRRGRRRRRARTAGAGVAALLAVAGTTAALTVLAPGDRAHVPAAPAPSPVPTATPTAAVAAPRAVVDPVAGTITLPLDAWMWSPTDQAVSDTAVELSVDRCMAAAGMEDEYEFRVAPVQPGRAQFGVWREQDVRAHGYQGLQPVDTGGTGLDGDDPRVATQRGCFQEAFARYAYDASVVGASAPAGMGTAVDRPEVAPVLAAWRECLAAEGVEPPGEDGWQTAPDGVLDAPMAEQVRIGLIDVACKESTGLVQRLADAEAAEQTAYLERAGEFLAELHAVQERALVESRAYLAAQGVTPPGE